MKTNKRNRAIKYLLLGVLLALTLIPAQSYAQGSSSGKCAWGRLEVGFINIGGGPGNFDAGDSICAFINQYRGANQEPRAFGAIFNLIATWMIVFTISAAMLSIMFGGYLYMTATGNGSQVQKAKIWIGSALLGITLSILAYAILQLISPNLV